MTASLTGSAFGFSGTISLSDPSLYYITASYLCYYSDSGFGIDYDIPYDDNLGAFTTGSALYSSSVQNVDPNEQFTLLAVYYDTATSTYGLAVGMNNASATAAVGQDFDSVFNFPDSDESFLMNAISGGEGSELQSFVFDQEAPFKDILAAYGDDNNELVGFSDGQVIGGISASPVPEPVSLALFGISTLLLLRKRKKQ
ncbi:MAG TPA: PEP-CTERM sorting domain-containing protein [Verrucomicrobiae bacterium]|nr:PEP-CTERM sorting domain-containing protein [Verrucomicrobiae bacterium]